MLYGSSPKYAQGAALLSVPLEEVSSRDTLLRSAQAFQALGTDSIAYCGVADSYFWLWTLTNKTEYRDLAGSYYQRSLDEVDQLVFRDIEPSQILRFCAYLTCKLSGISDDPSHSLDLISRSISLDPKPSYLLLRAQLYCRSGLLSSAAQDYLTAMGLMDRFKSEVDAFQELLLADFTKGFSALQTFWRHNFFFAL